MLFLRTQLRIKGKHLADLKLIHQIEKSSSPNPRINPLDPTGHPPEMFNIVTGQLACSSVNVHSALNKGRESHDNYESSLPGGFYAPIDLMVLFDHELAQIPTSLFTDDGNLLPATSK